MEYINLKSELGLDAKTGMFLGVAEKYIDDHGNLLKEDLATRLTQADVSIWDVDKVIAKNWIWELAVRDLLTRRIFDPTYRQWGFESVMDVGAAGFRDVTSSLVDLISKTSEISTQQEESRSSYEYSPRGKTLGEAIEDAWNVYYPLFLENDSERLEWVKTYAQRNLQRGLYPSVVQFFKHLSQEQHKHILSRNIPEALIPIFKELKFDSIELSQFEKAQSIRDFVYTHPNFETYNFFDDLESRSRTHKVLEDLKVDAFSVYVSKNKKIPKELIQGIDISLGRNYLPLDKLIELNS